MVPVSVMFVRAPGREKITRALRMLNGVQKFFAISAGSRALSGRRPSHCRRMADGTRRR